MFPVILEASLIDDHILFTGELSNNNCFVADITYPGLRIVGYSSTYHVFLLGLLAYGGLIICGILPTGLRTKHFIIC